MTELISLKDLGIIITKSLPSTKFHMKVEVSQPKITNGNLRFHKIEDLGNMYLGLKDQDGKIDGKIWKNVLTPSMKNIKNGDMIEIEGKLGYYTPFGNLSMIISDQTIAYGNSLIKLINTKYLSI